MPSPTANQNQFPRTHARTPSPINPLTGKLRANVPRIFTTSEMQIRLRDMLPGLRVYNPTDQWLQPEVHGITDRWLPPDLGGAIDAHPVTGVPTVCDGVVEIKGRYPMLDGKPQKDSSGKVIEGQDAASVVSFIVGSEQWGQIGIAFLPGRSQEEDEELKIVAHRVWMDYQKKADDEIIARRVEFVNNWNRNPAKKNIPCPPPSEIETSAVERQQSRAHERKFLYQCDVADCPGFAVNEWERFRTHMLAAHKIAVRRDQYDGETGALGPVVESEAANDSASIAAAALRKANIETAEILTGGQAQQPQTGDDDDLDDVHDVQPPAPSRSVRPNGKRR